MKYFIFVLGCQVNIHDSQKIKTTLDGAGYKSASEKEADFVIVLACSVRQSAVDRIFGHLKRWKDKKVYITGCVLPHDRKKLSGKIEGIFEIEELFKVLKISPPTTNNQQPNSLCYVPIMIGCDNFCTYCAVPYTRGRETSRDEKEILEEVEALVKSESDSRQKKIMLLGQNVNRYRSKSKVKGEKLKENDFTELLKKIVEIPGNFEISFMTSNPWDFPKELISLIAKEPKISKEIHLPVQSGDDEILNKMNRPYTVAEYLKLVRGLRSSVFGLRLSTDIIVGFPGETKEQFENTVALCKKAKFDKAYVAQYSPRPGTAAAKMKDDISRAEKKRRWKILDRLINK